MTHVVIENEPPGQPAVPRAGECVVCFVDRMTRAYGCAGRLLWAGIWRAGCAPRATALERRLGQKGGYCDCEVLMNAYVRRELLHARLGGGWGSWTEEDERLEQDPPACLGVRKGSTQACECRYGRRRGSW